MILTRPQPIKRWAIALAVAVALVSLAACGGGGGTTTKAPSGLVEDQLGFGQEALIERQSRIEATISDCMKAQGFQYVPIDPLAQRAAVTGSTRLSDEDFLKQFGYGISTLYGRGTPQNDPNEQIRASLSGADSAAYERALWSENAGATFSQAIETGDFERLGGCTKKATEAIFGGPETLTALQSKLEDLDQRIVQDQRMVRAIEQWVGCMTSAGYSISDPQDVDATITERFQAVVGRSVEPYATSAAPGATYDRAALETVQRYEVAVVGTDVSCEKEHIVPVENVVRPEYEAAFREENRALISGVRPAGG